MGRSFSVYLFCFAMDPLFHYLNRIPGVISVQAYVDDTTIAGTASLRVIQAGCARLQMSTGVLPLLDSM